MNQQQFEGAEVPKILNRDDALAVARMAEQSEQYDDMIAILKPYIIAKEDDLDFEERNILSVAYKNSVGMRRIAWRAVNKAKGIHRYEKYGEEMAEYQNKLEEECVDLCKDMLTLIQKQLLPKVKKHSQDPESEVYFLKLQADYFRYVAEVGSAEDRVEKAKTRALNSYNSAIEIADQLAPADPIRLSLYLNFSVYCYEIYDQKDKAIAIAKQGLAEAEDDIENIEKVKASES